jgi:catechol 2,3-dioxygenase-like lactoylglutathione lyase family enzyme
VAVLKQSGPPRSGCSALARRTADDTFGGHDSAGPRTRGNFERAGGAGATVDPRVLRGRDVEVTNDGPAWSIRSVLISVKDLDRSSTFYQDVMNLQEAHREDQLVVLTRSLPGSMLLYLRRAYRAAVHQGQQALGVRALSCDVGSFAELDRVEQRLRALGAFVSREIIEGPERFEAVRGLDPDRLPLALVAQQPGRSLTAADNEKVWTRLYGVDA